jgi:hypothetical protein
MFRRATSLLIVWFGLLAIIAPTMSCAAAVRHGDCCPPERTPPCGECPERRTPRAPDRAHCVVSPAQSVASAVSRQGSTEQGLSPDASFIVPANYPGASHSLADLAPRPTQAAAFASSAAFTYMINGRLRL